MNAYVYWVCGFKMSENQQKVSKSGKQCKDLKIALKNRFRAFPREDLILYLYS
jgi:hypothetical protein